MIPRQWFFILASLSLLVVAALSLIGHDILWTLLVIGPLVVVGLYDAVISKHNVLRNYPLIGHGRYFAEFIRPNIQQYFINTNQSGRPYSRETRDLVNARAEGGEALLPFGTQHDLMVEGDDFMLHSINVKHVGEEAGRVLIGGPDCLKPYDASRLNVSSMSFGSLSARAVFAINTGAKQAGCWQDTGEGSLSLHHLEGGGDLVWQLGTGYFGCRTLEGDFDPEVFAKKSRHDQVKMISIKLSQGAKPSHGGVLPAAKITPEIARIRGIPMGQDCLSPPTHSAFATPRELLAFVAQLRELSEGKPVGFKLCVGDRSEFLGIVKAMQETGIKPDFIQVDGAEGGTGAAPLEFTNRLGTPINEGLAFVHDALVGAGLRDDIRLIASGKIATGFDMITKMALGADICVAARAFMFTVGCIQALQCHSNTCPTGVATQDWHRTRALRVKDKAPRVANYHRRTLETFRDLLGAIGLDHPDQLRRRHIKHRSDNLTAQGYDEIYPLVADGALLSGNIPESMAADWAAAGPDHFGQS